MSEILDKIGKSVVEDFDNNLAKCFVMTAGTTLLNNGIKLWYTQKTLETKVEETEFGTVYKNTYSIMFDGIDTSEHDAKVRAEVIDEYKNKLWEDIETRYKNDIKILGYLSAENLLRDVHNAICYFAEQLKEEKC